MKITIHTKKNLIHAGILVGIFLVAVVFFSLIGGNKGTTDLTAEMAEASYPVVSFYYGEEKINEIYGYGQEMDGVYMRDVITPVEDNLTLQVVIDTYGKNITELSYQVRSIDTERLLEDTKVDAYEVNGSQAKATLQFQNLLEEDTEYLLILNVTSGNETYYYYSRIIKLSEDSLEQAISFAREFHNATFSESDGINLATYIEPDDTQTNTSLQYVNIHSSLNQILWGDFEPEIVSEEKISVAEVNEHYFSVKVEYVIGSENSEGSMRYYNVEEYYRLRIGEERIYLLDFERETEQIFIGESGSFYDNCIQLGIRDTDVVYKGSQSGTIVAFVQQGDLWSYNQETEEITKIFSFRGDDITDARQNSTEHDIQILNIDESGSIEFVLYGYMSRGRHEGEVGVGVYHYNSDTNVIEEEIFISSDKSYQVLAQTVGELFYVSSNNVFYMMTGGTLYGIDITEGTVQVLQEDLDSESFVVSDSGQYIAWIDADAIYSSQEIQIMDLETEEISKVTAGSGEYVQPLGYLDDDFVYGIADEADLSMDAVGNVTFPMSRVQILDEDLELVKEYSASGYYVVSAYESSGALHLERVTKSGTEYQEASEDTIINYTQSETDYNQVNAPVSEDAEQTQVQITMAADIENTSPRLVTAEEVISEKRSDVEILKQEDGRAYYYVYKGCKVIMSTAQLSDAVNEAYTDGGVVIGQKQQYIWNRGRQSSITISGIGIPDSAASADSVAQCVDAILNLEGISNNAESYLEQGSGIYEAMAETMSGYTVLDLSGCTVEEVLYYVAQGTPVLAMTDGNEAVLIVGYDEYNTTIFYPETQTTSKLGLEDSQTLFEAAGSIFVGYLK